MNLDTLSFRHLRAFQAAATHLHFRKAAEALNSTQPSLSRHIKELEETLGFRLFERHTRSVSLLPQGQILLDHVSKVFDQIDMAYQRAKSASAGNSGLLRIGVIGTPVMSYLHQPLNRFKKAYPDFEVSLEECASSEIVEKIANGILECGFFLSSVHHPNIDERVVARDRLMLAISDDNELANRSALNLGDLESQTMILFPKQRNPDLFNQIVNGIPGFTQSQLIEASSRQMAILMAAADFGIATIGESMKPLCPANVRCVPLKGKVFGSDIVMGWREGRTNPLAPFL